MSEPPLLPLLDAIRAVLDEVPEARVERVRIEEACGLVLAERVVSDLDMPPFAKSMMDGYAVRSADLARAPADLAVTETIHAGRLPSLPVGPGQAAKIMTGAPIPEGADAVVMVERTEGRPDDRVRIHHTPRPREHVSPRGEDLRAGDPVLEPGRRIGPSEIGVLAAVGCVEPLVRVARAAVFTTGDEVVPAAERPGPGCIRNSNSPALAARLRRDGAKVRDFGVLPDDLEATRAGVERAVGKFDVVVLTGGVSMGEKDLVGEALSLVGSRQVFHKICLKPGKPVLFGVAGGSIVFGLPGNPVSVAVTYELLVRPAVRSMLGLAPVHRPRVRAVLESETPRAIPREQYLPAVLRSGPDGATVARLSWHGSADLFGFAEANALLVVPAGGPAPEQGGLAEVVVLDDAPGCTTDG
jgi:molybdopterin molybdotransferase